MFFGKLSLKEAAVVMPSNDMVSADPLHRIFAEKHPVADASNREIPAKSDPFPRVDDIVDQLSDRIGYRDDQPTAIS